MRERNPHAHVVGAIGARIDPTLLYDVSDADEGSGQLSFRELLLDAATPGSHAHEHVHAASVTATSDGCVDPGALLDLLEEPPAGVYRLKGTVAVRYRERVRSYVVNVVGLVGSRRDRAADGARPTVSSPSGPTSTSTTCAPGSTAALRPHDGTVSAAGMRRLQRYRRLSF